MGRPEGLRYGTPRMIFHRRRSELEPAADADGTRWRDRGPREHAGKIDDVQPVGRVGDLAAKIEPPPIAAPQLDAGTEIDRERRLDASFVEVDALDDLPTVVRNQIVHRIVVVDLDREAAAVANDDRGPGARRHLISRAGTG